MEGNRVSCPSCTALLGIPQSAKGEHMKCPKCKKIFKLIRDKSSNSKGGTGRDAGAGAAASTSTIDSKASDEATGKEGGGANSLQTYKQSEVAVGFANARSHQKQCSKLILNSRVAAARLREPLCDRRYVVARGNK